MYGVGSLFLQATVIKETTYVVMFSEFKNPNGTKIYSIVVKSLESPVKISLHSLFLGKKLLSPAKFQKLKAPPVKI